MSKKKNIIKRKFVQFGLNNPTSSAVTVDLFDTNTLSLVPSNDSVSFPNQVTPQISVSTTNYSQIVYNPTTDRIWSANSAGVIAIINPQTSTVLTTFTASVVPNALVYITPIDEIWGYNGSQIIRFNPSGSEIGTFIVTGFPTFTAMTLCGSTNDVYLADTANETVILINPFTLAVDNTISLPVGANPVQLIYASTTDKMYVLTQTASVRVINCQTEAIIATVGAYNCVTGCFVSDNNEVWIYDNTSNDIIKINSSSDTAIGTISGYSAPFSLTYVQKVNYVYVGDFSGGNVDIIDADDDSAVLTMAGFTGFKGVLYYAPSVNYMYATGASTAIIQVISASGSRFYIDGSSDYNQFVQDNLITPKKADRIVIYGEQQSDIDNGLIMIQLDATGIECQNTILPNIATSNNQYQSQISQNDFKMLVFNSDTKIRYVIPAFTSIQWVVYYREIKEVDLLSGRSILEEGSFDVHDNDHLSYTVEDLNRTKWLPAFVRRNG